MVWFLYVTLKFFSVSPMQDDEDWRQFLLSGHVFFSQQLHVLLFFV